MALRNLVEAQCGEGNPLISLTHHITKDKAHKEERQFLDPKHEIDTFKSSYEIPFSADQLAEEFMNETRNAVTTPQTFRMDTLLQEMQAIERVPPILGPGVADLASEAGTWCEEYLDSEDLIEPYNLENEFVNEYGVLGKSEPYETDWHFEAEAQWNKATAEKEKNEDSSTWLKEFSLQEDTELAKTANELLGTVDDPKFSNTEFMKYVRTLGKSSQLEDLKSWQNEYLKSSHPLEAGLWSQEFISTNPIDEDSWGTELLKEVANHKQETQTKSEEWQQEFDTALRKGNMDDVTIDSEAMNAKQKEEFWEQLQKDWNKAAEETDGKHPWLSDYEADFVEPYKEYSFKENNPVKDHPDPLSEGKKCLEIGDVPSAVLFFEAAVQQKPDCGEAWLLLGATHAENEQDPSAISALKKGVELDSSSLKGWMALATSYTNESYQNLACYALKEWIKNNEDYSHLIEEKVSSHPKVLVASLASREQVNEVQDLYIKAANLRPADNIDEEVQCGLGILLNLTGDYDKAVDCFQYALHKKPTDAQLWNKLGATLANSNRSAEAIDAYRHALELSPGFIRCRYNLGIACINLGSHREAMEHFLEALNMQNKSKGSNGPSLAVSDNIWSTVRICLKSLDEQRLLEAVQNRDLNKLNDEFGFGSAKS